MLHRNKTLLLVGMLFGFTQSAAATAIGFSGQLGLVDVDTGVGVYTGKPLGTQFSGEIDDANFNGFISDGLQVTHFGCCIAAGGMQLTNDIALGFVGASVLNQALGTNRYKAQDLVDVIDIEGDALTRSGGRIEVGLSYLFDHNAFANEDPGNYPVDPAYHILTTFFIFEEDANGKDVYSAGGIVSAVPLPAAFWFLGSGLGVLGLRFRKKG